MIYTDVDATKFAILKATKLTVSANRVHHACTTELGSVAVVESRTQLNMFVPVMEGRIPVSAI